MPTYRIRGSPRLRKEGLFLIIKQDAPPHCSCKLNKPQFFIRVKSKNFPTHGSPSWWYHKSMTHCHAGKLCDWIRKPSGDIPNGIRSIINNISATDIYKNKIKFIDKKTVPFLNLKKKKKRTFQVTTRKKGEF